VRQPGGMRQLWKRGRKGEIILKLILLKMLGRDSIVGIVTCYGLDGPGIESRWGEILRTRPDRPCGPTSFLYSGYMVLPGGKVAGPWR
jgi:hypothetical protein